MAAYFSSSPDIIDNSDIDAIIAEATDLCALEQIAALNTAHLSDSYLPSNLETRFRKLKTFPGTNSHPSPTTPTHPPPPPQSTKKEEEQKQEKENITATPTADPKPDQETESIKKPKPPTTSVSPHPPPSPPPPRQACCFGFSPKKIQRRKSNADVGDVGEHDDIFAEFGSCSSMKEHRRRLKKVWKEQEMASREADKMAKWVKQVSTRIREASLDDLLDDDFK